MRRALGVLVALALLGVLGTGLARGERAQRGNLIVALDGDLSPLKLPRDHLAPVAIRLDGGLNTTDGSLLPRVTRIELGLPTRGVLSTRGLPTCDLRRLRNTKPPEALAACRGALIGRGRLDAKVVVPKQAPFTIRARLLAFNGRIGGHRAVLLHSYAASPPIVAIVPFLIRPGSGRFGTALVADLSAALGPWPRFAHFEMTLSRRYVYRGRHRSYLSAACPVPPSLTAGFFSLAKLTLTVASGRAIGIGIARGCRAR